MAGKLVLEFDGKQILERALDKESILIGRRPTSDIQIDNLAVSGTHARVLTILNDSFLEDMESTNGVFVNGKRVKKHALSHGDVVAIGKHELRYENPEADASAGDDYAETILLNADKSPFSQKSGNDTMRRAQAAAGAPTAGGNIGPAKLELLDAQGNATKSLNLTKALTTIGKPGVQVAAVSRRQQGDFIVHVESESGSDAVPVVNGESIGYKSKLLKNEDVIEIAGVRMRYRLG